MRLRAPRLLQICPRLLWALACLLCAGPALAQRPSDPPPPWCAGLEVGGHFYRVGSGALSGADQRVANGLSIAGKLERAILPWLSGQAALGLVPTEATAPSSGGVLALYARLGARFELPRQGLRPFGEASFGLARYAAEARSATTWLLAFGAGASYMGESWPVAIEAGARWYGHGPDNAVRDLPAAGMFVSGEVYVGVSLPFGGGRPSDRLPDEPDESAHAPAAAFAAAVGPTAEPAPEVSLPLAFLAGDKVELVEPIAFERGSATLVGESHKVLEAVAGLLAQNPGTLVIRVAGPARERALAQKRAQGIEFFLLGLGADPARLSSETYSGPDGQVQLLLKP